MNDTNPSTTPGTTPAGPSTERVLWWVTLGVLAFAALAMLSLWN